MRPALQTRETTLRHPAGRLHGPWAYDLETRATAKTAPVIFNPKTFEFKQVLQLSACEPALYHRDGLLQTIAAGPVVN